MDWPLWQLQQTQLTCPISDVMYSATRSMYWWYLAVAGYKVEELYLGRAQ